MSNIIISDQFDAGNIEVIKAEDHQQIELAIRKDNQSDFFQWFYFSIETEVGKSCKISIVNAGESSYAKGWEGYNVCTSYDRQTWFRTPAEYKNGKLEFEFEMTQSTIYFAYFTPYSYERHLDLLSWANLDERVQQVTLGKTLQGRGMTVLNITDASNHDKKDVWITARQHPGESMAEWFVEGFLQALLDHSNPLAKKLLATTRFHVVANMNPDGSVLGNLRTNAAGANLNREWQNPTMEKSPEVFLVRQAMKEIGGDLFLDIHGDEELPYNFVAGCEGNPSYDEKQAHLEQVFKTAYIDISPDFQDEIGYEKDKFGEANLSLAANWLGDYFRTLSFTIEMPFKDNNNLPDEDFGWSSERSMKLGADVLYPIFKTLEEI